MIVFCLLCEFVMSDIFGGMERREGSSTYRDTLIYYGCQDY